MKLTLDAYVSPDVVANAWNQWLFAAADERPLNELEALGWLVLSHNITAVLTMASSGRATRPDYEMSGESGPPLNPDR